MAGSSIPGGQSQDCRGISISSSNNVVLETVNVSNTSSVKGKATAVDVMFESSNISITGTQIYNVKASEGVSLTDVSFSDHPVQLNEATGVHVGNQVKFITLDAEVTGTVEGLTSSDLFKVD